MKKRLWTERTDYILERSRICRAWTLYILDTMKKHIGTMTEEEEKYIDEAIRAENALMSD